MSLLVIMGSSASGLALYMDIKMIIGYILVVLVIALCSYRFKRIKKIKGIKNIHKCLGVLTFIMLLLHAIATYKVWKNRDILLIISGVLIGIFILIMSAAYLFKMRDKWMKIHRFCAYVVSVFIVIHIVVYFIDFFQYKNNIHRIKIQDINAEELEDGVYTGEYDAGYIYAKVNVYVEGKQIVNIEIVEHRNERGEKAEQITDRIVEQQEINVDSVSGATNSSLVIKKAVENALTRR